MSILRALFDGLIRNRLAKTSKAVPAGQMRTEKTELSVMKYHDFTKVSLSVCPDCPTPCFVIVRGERDLSATILVAKFTCIEKLEKVTSIFNEHQRTMLTIILSGDRLQCVMPGPDKSVLRIQTL